MKRGIAVITGGSGGIGRACAMGLMQMGYEVVLSARKQEPLAKVASELGCKYVVGDSAEEADARALFQAVEAPRLVVHAAGILAGTFVSEQPVETFDEVLRANLRSAYLVTKYALEKMSAGSRIIFISSTAGLKGMKGLTAYSASKAGMEALAQSVAAEVERFGIGVHLVTPGPVRTAMIDPSHGPTMWLLEPEDVASAVCWLAGLSPRVVVREIVMRSVAEGPFAPEPVGKSPAPRS